ncbi:Alg9-like mannosyltransferase family-domain-containing protein [Chytriomyces sp. MP71]|nr:Alg9-like mannosyltransferase family-domain-containing protein [Chytriomyces sp. MP71]
MPSKRATTTFPSNVALACIVTYRLYNALLIRTFFSPDEFWQSLEIAHERVFGSGYLTWEWTHGVRGFAHPALFAAVFWVLNAVGLGDDAHAEWLVVAPKLVQGIFAALCDIFTFLLARRLFGPVAAKWALFASLVAFFNAFCAVRTFSNSIETSLTAVAMYYWPWPVQGAQIVLTRARLRDLNISLTFAAIACILRPTNAVIWIFLGVSLLRKLELRGVRGVLSRIALIGAVALGASTALDTAFYQTPTFVPYTFFRFNLAQGIASFYGVHTWHWYLSQGLPVVLFTLLPFTAWTLLKRGGDVRGVSVATVCLYSCVKHKEFRFVMPLLPVWLASAGEALRVLEAWAEDAGSAAGKADHASGGALRVTRSAKAAAESCKHGKSSVVGVRSYWRCVSFRAALVGLVVTNFTAAFYLGVVHQRGVLDVMTWLRKEDRGERGVLFMMPCHSTPFHSHLHKRDVEMRFITCEPPLDPAINKTTYQDESDVFYADPLSFIDTYFLPIASTPQPGIRTRTDKLLPVPGQDSYLIQQFLWPSRVVVFAALLERVGQNYFQDLLGYRECARFFNSHFHDDSRRAGDVVVYCR